MLSLIARRACSVCQVILGNELTWQDSKEELEMKVQEVRGHEPLVGKVDVFRQFWKDILKVRGCEMQCT